MGIIDSRSVKTSHHVIYDRGIKGSRNVKGGKRHVVVDAQGNLIFVAAYGANTYDSKGVQKVIENLSCKFPHLVKILAG